ncbi:MAG: arylesterase [Mariprofundaceae bacterium]|nr:arylesterase [Mariprofundaceae bacterium]
MIEADVSMINRILLCLSLMLLPWPAATAAGEHPCIILVLGDSLSAAYGMSMDEGWVSLLNTQLKQEKYRCKVINASVSGDTTQGGRARLPSLLKKHQPSHLIIELGANNGLRALPAELMEQDLKWIIQSARAAGSRVLLLGMQMPPNYGPQYRARFSNVYRNIAEAEGVSFVPFFLEGVITRSEWMQADALHPNALGQPALLENVWSELILMLPKKL